MKNFFVLFCGVLLFSSSLAQTKRIIKGAVLDTVNNYPLANSTISILNAKDSTLYKFGRASNDGSFKIDGLKPGKLILLVTYPDFADYVEHFTLELSKEVQDFGRLHLLK